MDPSASFSKVTSHVCSHRHDSEFQIYKNWNFHLSLRLSKFSRIVELHPNATWLIIVQESTRINWSELVDLTQGFDPDKVIGSCACILNNKKK